MLNALQLLELKAELPERNRQVGLVGRLVRLGRGLGDAWSGIQRQPVVGEAARERTEAECRGILLLRQRQRLLEHVRGAVSSEGPLGAVRGAVSSEGPVGAVRGAVSSEGPLGAVRGPSE
jgi:hypothetical protein